MNNNYEYLVSETSIKTKEGKEITFIVVSIVINNLPLEIGRFIKDDKILQMQEIAKSFTNK